MCKINVSVASMSYISEYIPLITTKVLLIFRKRKSRPTWFNAPVNINLIRVIFMPRNIAVEMVEFHQLDIMKGLSTVKIVKFKNQLHIATKFKVKKFGTPSPHLFLFFVYLHSHRKGLGLFSCVLKRLYERLREKGKG